MPEEAGRLLFDAQTAAARLAIGTGCHLESTSAIYTLCLVSERGDGILRRAELPCMADALLNRGRQLARPRVLQDAVQYIRDSAAPPSASRCPRRPRFPILSECPEVIAEARMLAEKHVLREQDAVGIFHGAALFSGIWGGCSYGMM